MSQERWSRGAGGGLGLSSTPCTYSTALNGNWVETRFGVEAQAQGKTAYGFGGPYARSTDMTTHRMAYDSTYVSVCAQLPWNKCVSEMKAAVSHWASSATQCKRRTRPTQLAWHSLHPCSVSSMVTQSGQQIAFC